MWVDHFDVVRSFGHPMMFELQGEKKGSDVHRETEEETNLSLTTFSSLENDVDGLAEQHPRNAKDGTDHENGLQRLLERVEWQRTGRSGRIRQQHHVDQI